MATNEIVVGRQTLSYSRPTLLHLASFQLRLLGQQTAKTIIDCKTRFFRKNRDYFFFFLNGSLPSSFSTYLSSLLLLATRRTPSLKAVGGRLLWPFFRGRSAPLGLSESHCAGCKMEERGHGGRRRGCVLNASLYYVLGTFQSFAPILHNDDATTTSIFSNSFCNLEISNWYSLALSSRCMEEQKFYM